MAHPATGWMNVGMLLELLPVLSFPFQDFLDFHIPIFTYSKVILGSGQGKKGTFQLCSVKRVYKVIVRQGVGEP